MTTLVSKYKNAFFYVGKLLQMVSFVMVMPLLSLLFYPEEFKESLYFLLTAIILLMFSRFLIYINKETQHQKLVKGEDAIIVVFTWLLTMFFSSLPFVFSQQLPWFHAMFEAISGWTTTGLSVVDVESIPKIYLMFRSIIQFFGGVGLVLVFFALLSETFGLRLYYAEGHNDRLLPNLKKSARVVMKIYLFYLVVGILLLVFAKMPFFDAINIAMTSLSTGGFAITNASIASYNSSMIESIIIVLMLLGATNFAGHLLLFSKKFKQFIATNEIKYVVVAVIGLTSILMMLSFQSQSITIRIALFEAVSAITTTGFTITSYTYWPATFVVLLVLFMIIGGGSGSTAGGIKQLRAIMIFKSIALSMKKRFLPNQVVKDIIIDKGNGKQPVDDKGVLEVFHFIAIYLFLLLVGTLVIAMHGYSLEHSLFEFASALGTVGTSVGITSIDAPKGVLFVEMIGMFFGRLEIMVVLLAFLGSVKDITKIANLRVFKDGQRN